MSDSGPTGRTAATDTHNGQTRVSSTYRCFLFADLRGYTSYIERAGNAAGVELLDEYLSIVRRAVAQYDGAEIKVEGDGFHAVFPSASSAVMCGLAITNAAEEANAARPDRPIRVGIGIHAGEAVDTPDGFIGSAVNIAARVCAAAASGEVLVTATVRGITHASIPVRFVNRGRRRLKGIPEPVELFAALPEGGVAPAAAPRARLRWLAVGAAAVLALAVLVAAIALPGIGQSTPTPAPSPTPRPLAIGPLQLGMHVADSFTPTFSFTIDDPGWSVYRVYPDALGLRYEGPPVGRLDIGNIPLLYSDPCITEGGPEVSTGTSIDDLMSALEEVPYLQITEPTAAEIGGFYAESVDITVDPGAQAACGGFGTEGVAVFRVAEDVWNVVPGEVFRLRAVEVDATTVSFIASAEASPAGAVSEIHQFLERADRVIQSVDFE